MLLPAPPLFPRKRNRRKTRATWEPSPVIANVSIVSVTATETGDGIVLFDSQTITAVTDVSQLELEFNWVTSSRATGT
jgi:hypothetical protein